jgi:hypothetical protein
VTAPRSIIVGGELGDLYAARELGRAPVHFTLLQGGGADVILTNEKAMNENLLESRLWQ